MTSSDLAARLAFLKRLDELKRVERQTVLMDGSRHENTAEHSWHLAMMALVLLPYARDRENMDPLAVVTMALIHDIPEIIAGDAYVYDDAARKRAEKLEREAADSLFGILPPFPGQSFHTLWVDFAEGRTPEARFVAAVDRLQPVLQNVHSGGIMWREHGVYAGQVLVKNQVMQRGAPELWDYAVDLIRQAVEAGILPAMPKVPTSPSGAS